MTSPYHQEPKLFGKWTYENIVVDDISLQDYIQLNGKCQVWLPHTAGRYAAKRFRKATCPIVERLVNSLMMHGRNSGKKIMAVRIVKHCFDLIHIMTKENPIVVYVNAVVNAGPREDTTRIGSAGVARRQAVDVSPLRRTNVAIHHMTMGARTASFRSLKTIAECLADEIVYASEDKVNSFAIKKKDEIERVAKSCR
ncbi:hypothetical protein AAMO2058_001421300 [Amorphochlora amoebiformis]